MSKCVLIVEDEELLLDQLDEALTDAGYSTLRASNPYDAYYILEETGVDLLLTDIGMSGKADGAMLATEVSRQWPQIAIIVISGLAPKLDDIPADARFLAKPFALSDLIAEVGRALGS